MPPSPFDCGCVRLSCRRLHGRPMVGSGVKPGRGAGTACPARGRGSEYPSSGCRGLKAACSMSRARKLWSWVPGCESSGEWSRGAIALVWFQGRCALVGTEGKAPVMGRREHEGSPDGSGVNADREGCNGRAKRLPCQADGRSVRPWLAKPLNTSFRIPRNGPGFGVGSYAARALRCGKMPAATPSAMIRFGSEQAGLYHNRGDFGAEIMRPSLPAAQRAPRSGARPGRPCRPRQSGIF
ncbi:hypothetical protein AKL17_2p0004 (plasmid) [Frigidibacter mobilis]|uniref:Uncharacterized protein n=1 Tax=Frigidibacter mobilis TaxID=1335048 RepID=A0A159Z959_9RHOB|nr:hypothetical protein AKL17_2p0004 [Frigidibacter mobilis]